jgi:hypothetical protein
MSDRPIPLLGDIALASVQRIEHFLDAGFAGSRVVGLEGELQQRAGRPSHEIRIAGVLFGDDAKDTLGTLQAAAQVGDELTFSADITSALDLQRVVIRSFHAEQIAGEPVRSRYLIELRESPPLPPPAQVSAFGGLDGFGLGDLGIDPGVLGEIAGLASDIAGAVDTAMGAISALDDIAGLVDGFNGVMDPLQGAVDGAAAIGEGFRKATQALGDAFK